MDSPFKSDCFLQTNLILNINHTQDITVNNFFKIRG